MNVSKSVMQKVKKRYQSGEKPSVVAAAEGVKLQEVYNILTAMGVPRRRRGRPKGKVKEHIERNKKMAALYESGLSLREIGRQFERSYEAVRVVLKSEDVELRTPGPQGIEPTAEQNALIATLRRNGESLKRIAASTSVSIHRVTAYCRERKIKSLAADNADKRRQKMLRLYQDGVSVLEIAMVFGVCKDTVHKVAWAAGVYRVARTTPEERAEGARLVNKGAHVKDVAQQFGVTQAAVYQWLKKARQ